MVVKLLQRRTQVDAISLTAWQMGLGGLPLIAAALLTHSGWPVWSGTFVLTLAYSALLSNAVCWVLWAYALHSLPAGAAGVGRQASPVVGVIAAWILRLGEAPALLRKRERRHGAHHRRPAVLAARGLLAARRGAMRPASSPNRAAAGHRLTATRLRGPLFAHHLATLGERQQIVVDLIFEGRAQAVGGTLVDLQRGVLDDLRRDIAKPPIGTIWSSSP